MLPVVQIVARSGAIAGAGLACYPKGLILTCNHVVTDALGLPRKSAAQRGDRVLVRVVSAGWESEAELLRSSPLDGYDLALLRLAHEFPAALSPAAISDVPLPPGTQIRLYGYPRGYDQGVWGYGTIQHEVTWGRLQVEARNIAPGFSGAPVEELQLGRVVGLMSASDLAREAAFVIPAAAVRAFCPEVAVAGTNQVCEVLTEGLMGLPGDPLSGLEQFLNGYLGSVDKPVPFGGRDDQLRELDEWLAQGGFPCALISAPAGRGKSALVTRWAAKVAAEGRADVAFVPVSNRFETSRRVTMASLLGKRLRFLCGGETAQPKNADDWISEIGSRLRTDRAADERPLLVVMDGLDEAADWIAGQDFRFPARLGRGVRILAAARILGGDTGDTAWLERLNWEECAACILLPNLDAQGIQQVLDAMGDPLSNLQTRVDLVGQLLRLSEGDPLLVSLYVEALLGAGTRSAFLSSEELPEIPPGLEGFVNNWMLGQRRQWEARGEDADALQLRARVLLYALSCAFGPLSESDVAEIAPAGSGLDDGIQFRQIVRIVERFVIGDGQRTGYVFSHPRLRDYFGRMIRNPAEREEWQRRFIDYGVRTVDALAAGRLRPSEVSRYIVQYHRVHLVRGGAAPPEFYRLVTRAWMEAWFAFEGGYNGFLVDVNAAADVARAQSNRAVEVACALCHGSTVSLSSSFFPELVFQCVRHRIMSAQQALAIIQRMHDEQAQSASLTLIAPLLGAGFLEYALDFARSLQNPVLRLQSAGAVASLLPGSRQAIVFRDVFAGIGEIRDSEARTEILAALCSHAPRKYMDDVFAELKRLGSWRQRVRLLAAMSPHLDRELARSALRLALECPWAEQRAEALHSLAPAFSRFAISESLSAVEQMPLRLDRARYLSALCSHHRSMSISEQVLDLVRRLKDERDKATALAAFAPYIPAELVSEAVGLALSLEEEDARAHALEFLGRRATPDCLERIGEAVEAMSFDEHAVRIALALLPVLDPSYQDLAVEAADDIRDSLARASLLLDVASHLTRDCRGKALDEVVRIALASLDDPRTPEIIARAAKSLDSQHHDRLLSRLLQQPAAPRAALLKGLLPHLEIPQLRAIIENLAPIHDIGEQAALFSRMAEYASGALIDTVMESVTAAANEDLTATALIALAPRMDAAGLLRASLEAQSMQVPRNAAELFAAIAVHSATRESVAAAIESLWTLESDPLARTLLARIEPYLDESTVFPALDVARRRLDGLSGRSLLPFLVTHLNAELRQGIPAEVLIRAFGMDAAEAASMKLAVTESRPLPRLRQIADGIADGYWQAGVKVALLAATDVYARPLHFDWTFAAVEAAGDQAIRENLLTMLRMVPPDLPDERLQQMLAYGYLLERSERFDCMTVVAACRPELLFREAFEGYGEWRGDRQLINLLAANTINFLSQWRLLHRMADTFQPGYWNAGPKYWSLREVRNYASEGDEEAFADALAQMAPNLRFSPLLAKTLRRIRSFVSADVRARALWPLVRHAPVPLVISLTLETLKQVREPYMAEILCDIAPLLYDADASAAYELALGMQFGDNRQKALRALRPQLSAVEARNCTRELLRTIETEDFPQRPEVIREVARSLRPHQALALLPIAWTIWDEEARTAALSALPAHDPGGAAAAALKTGRAALRVPRSQVLCTLAGSVPEEMRESVISEALGALRQRGSNAVTRVSAVLSLVCAAHGAARRRAFAALLHSLQAANPLQSSALALRASRKTGLTEKERRELISLAWQSTKEADAAKIAFEPLDELWGALNPDAAREAWLWSWSIWSLENRGRVQERLAREWYAPPDETAVGKAAAFVDPAARCEALWELAPHAEGAATELWPRLLTAVGQISSSRLTLAWFSRILPAMPPEYSRHALRVAARLYHNRDEAIAILLSRLAGEHRDAMVSQLRTLLESEVEEERRVMLLVRFAADLAGSYSSEALRCARTVENAEGRAQAMSAILPLLPEKEAAAAAEEIVSAAATGSLDWPTFLDISRSLCRWAAGSPSAAAHLWQAGLKHAADEPRPTALLRLSMLVPAAVAANRPEQIPEIGQAVREVCSWWA